MRKSFQLLKVAEIEPFENHDPLVEQMTNTQALGSVIYTEYIFAFQISGFILLLAMIGAITLTQRTRSGVRKQNIEKQVATSQDDAMSVQKVEVGKGIE